MTLACIIKLETILALASVINYDRQKVMLQFGASLTDDTRSVNYDRNTFIIQATVFFLQNLATCCFQSGGKWVPRNPIITKKHNFEHKNKSLLQMAFLCSYLGMSAS